MTIAEVESGAWSRLRWWSAITAAVAIQIGLIFWLGDHSRVEPRKAPDEPQVLMLPEFAGELADLNNPTLFARANRRGFSGVAWLEMPPLEYHPVPWSEPPRFLELPSDQLGGMIHDLVRSGMPAPPQVARKSEPTILLPALPTAVSSLPTQSQLRVGGELAVRKLVSRFALQSWPYNDVLTNSVVRVVVDAEGRTHSAALLSSSGLAEADQQALSLARAAQFESLLGSGPERLSKKVPAFTFGYFVFSWHTIPLPDTNAPASKP